jgi:hypothetical protein
MTDGGLLKNPHSWTRLAWLRLVPDYGSGLMTVGNTWNDVFQQAHRHFGGVNGISRTNDVGDFHQAGDVVPLSFC